MALARDLSRWPLSGVSLAMAHQASPHWRAFWRRILTIAAAAALVSAATFWVAPTAPIFFGILHCILAASLLGGLLLRAPPAAALVVGAILIVAPFVYTSPDFNSAGLVWLGLGAQDPSTLDWRPLAPWAGVTLVGMGLARFALPALRATLLAQWRANSVVTRALCFAGRHSLAIYLTHQPVLLGLVFVVAQLSGVAERQATEQYLASCRPACVEAGGEIETCARACACVVRKAAGSGLARSLGARDFTQSDRGRLGPIVDACGVNPD